MTKRDRALVESVIKRLVDLSCNAIENKEFKKAKRIGSESAAIYRLVTADMGRMKK